MNVDAVVTVPCNDVPTDSEFKGYNKFLVQDLIIEVKTTEYRLERWKTPDGKYITASVPTEIAGSHFGPGLKRYILFQHHSNRVPQNKIHEELCEMGINISAGQIDKILNDAVQQFRHEKEEILDVGLRNSQCIGADDTGARHAGKNGFCLVVRNDLFAYYASTQSKSRINFLKVLQGKNSDFVINEATTEYCETHKFKDKLLAHVHNNGNKIFQNEAAWQDFLNSYAMTTEQQKIFTEGAMIGSLVHHGISKNIVLVSDDAGQFNLFVHALCWAHAIRNIQKVVTADDATCAEVDQVLEEMRKYYKKLKEYQKSPSQKSTALLWSEFDAITDTTVINPALRKALDKLARNKDELLKVLKYPFIPLTNNGSERDIRTYVIKRKISGGTRSENGREARDTFTSLFATCRKNGVSVWDYLIDRIQKINTIPYLSELIKAKAQSATSP